MAKDGDLNELFIVQARPETVQSQKEGESLKTYTLEEKGRSLLEGLSIGEAIAAEKPVSSRVPMRSLDSRRAPFLSRK
jgi:pyruvate, water dikinase